MYLAALIDDSQRFFQNLSIQGKELRQIRSDFQKINIYQVFIRKYKLKSLLGLRQKQMTENSFRIRQIQGRKTPSKIGHYIIGEILGRGGYATVHRAVESFTQTEVAVKIMDLSQLEKKEVLRLKRECEILRQVSHPNIVKIYEFIQSNSKLYIFMELIQGKELFELVSKKGPVSELIGAKILHQICSAVKYLHERGIVHRDIKPENIMVDPSFNAKLIDFGLAKKFNNGEDELLETICGSPSYTAPQIAEKRKYDGKAVDIWCLGVSLYVMLEAALPFDQNDEVHRKKKSSSISWVKPEFSSAQAQQLYAGIFKPSKERINIDELLESGLFKKYQLQQKSYYKSWESLQCTHLDLSPQNVKKIAEWLKIDAIQVRMEIVEKKLTASYCLYELLMQKKNSNNLTENHEVKIVTARTTSKEPRPIHSQNHYSTTRSQTPKKLQLTQKMPLRIYEKYMASKEKVKFGVNQIKLTDPKKKEVKGSIQLRNRLQKSNIFSKIAQVQFPKCKLRDDSPESPKRILDYVRAYN